MAHVTGFDLSFEICQITGFAGGISDKIEAFRSKASDDGIVNYASSSRVQEAGKGRAVIIERGCGRGSDLFE